MSRTPSSRLADADARQAIQRRLDLNILVEAGAGSGKTHSLAGRMAAGIVSGQYVVEEMAAVTFTRKAAAELRGRFQMALERRLAGASPEERARIETALGSLEHLFAGTIHAFCAHLLRERPVEANVAPGFTEADELEDAGLRQRAWRDYLSRLRAEDSPLLLGLQQAGVAEKDLDQAFERVCTFDEVEFPPGSAPMPDTARAKRAADAFHRKLTALMPNDVSPDAKCKTLEREKKFRRLLRAATGGRPADLAAALRCWQSPPGVTMCWWAEGREAGRAIREKVDDLVGAFGADVVAPFLADWRRYVYRLAMTLLAGARESAREARRRSLSLNYGDLLSLAAELLRGNAGVRAALQRKYRWLLVDEFQDTDPIQAEVMLLLAADESQVPPQPGQPVDPFALPLRPGALFVVGDPKQSIYRFRRADIDTYNRVRQVIEKTGGRVLSLTTSFRARPELCEWNNDTFEDLLPEAATPQQAAFGRLDPDPAWTPRRTWPRGERGLRTLTIPEEVPRPALPAASADAIARYIRSEVDEGRASWDDFLVLTRKKAQLAVYAAALQALEIPVEVSGAGAFGARPVVRALIELLRTLGDPADEAAIVGVLRGPMFGVSDAQLFEHRREGGRFRLPGRRATDAGPASAVAQALDRLADCLRLARTLPLPSAVEQILEDSGLLALAVTAGAGGAAAGDLLHAVDLVREAAEEGGSLADAVAALDAAAASSDIESVPLEPGRRDVVRVMNLHKAKGLEATVVFLADPMGGVRHDVHVRIVRDGNGARGYLTVSREIGEHASEVIAEPEGWNEHAAEEQAYQDAEERRLLYVAATRAREMLVVSRWAKNTKSHGPWSLFDAGLNAAPELKVPEPAAPSQAQKAALSLKERTRAAGARVRRHAGAREATWAVTAVTTALAAQKGKPDEEEQAATGDVLTPVSEAAGAGWGSLVHGLLEHAMRQPDATPADLERLARWLVVETPELAPFISSALALVERTRRSAFWQEARAGGEASVEVPFAVGIPAGQAFAGLPAAGVPTVLHGVIDLLYRGEQGWTIVDYKTDLAAARGEALLSHHAPQLALYRAAFERTTGNPIARHGIVALRTGEVEWEV